MTSRRPQQRQVEADKKFVRPIHTTYNMLNQENKNEGMKGLFPWWLPIGVGVALGAGMGTVTGQMNVCALAALVFGSRS